MNTPTSIAQLNQKLDLLIEKLDDTNKKVDSILELLNSDISNNCNKMKHHIDFIEEVYENIKHPLNYACKKISYLSRYETNKELEN
tara:strand:+ start:11361 stop:11618 length:258 start_codon:yes stop_codon:yes gene_type:complete